MYVSAARAGDERIAVSCSFANTGDRPLLVGENIDIGYYIRTPDSFESDAVEASQMAAPNHYVLLPVVPLNRRGGKTFMDGEFISRQVMIHARNEIDRMAGTLEVVADLELLQYDTKTKRLESRRETITRITELPDTDQKDRHNP